MPVAPDRAKEPTGGERFRLPRFTDGFTPGHTYRYRYSCRRCRTKKQGARSPKTRPRRPLFAVRRTILRSGKRCTGIRRENLPPVFPADHIIEKALFPNRPAETTSDVPQTSPILRNPACGIFRLFAHGTFQEAGTFVRRFIYRSTLSKKRTVFSGPVRGNDEHSAQSRFLRIRPRYV